MDKDPKHLVATWKPGGFTTFSGGDGLSVPDFMRASAQLISSIMHAIETVVDAAGENGPRVANEILDIAREIPRNNDSINAHVIMKSTETPEGARRT